MLGIVVTGVIGYAYLKPPATASAPIEAVALTPTTTNEETATTIFELDPATSRARYMIDEVLRGAPVTVVGETDQVAGQVAVDLANTDSTQLGTIQINARTFATDESQRDRAVQNRILLTDQYEYITFTPTALLGLPESLPVGQVATFQIVGDLTIRDVTRPVTFDATLTPLAAHRLAGSATTTIRQAEWNIAIPSVPFVASVAETAQLELEFEAVAMEQ
jgi:polyisoprenoid-binding protein YceI